MSFHLHVLNLRQGATNQNLRQLFAGMDIEEDGVTIIGGPEGEAFVTFGNQTDLLRALKRNGEQHLKFKVATEMEKLEATNRMCIAMLKNIKGDTASISSGNSRSAPHSDKVHSIAKDELVPRRQNIAIGPGQAGESRYSHHNQQQRELVAHVLGAPPNYSNILNSANAGTRQIYSEFDQVNPQSEHALHMDSHSYDSPDHPNLNRRDVSLRSEYSPSREYPVKGDNLNTVQRGSHDSVQLQDESYGCAQHPEQRIMMHQRLYNAPMKTSYDDQDNRSWDRHDGQLPGRFSQGGVERDGNRTQLDSGLSREQYRYQAYRPNFDPQDVNLQVTHSSHQRNMTRRTENVNYRQSCAGTDQQTELRHDNILSSDRVMHHIPDNSEICRQRSMGVHNIEYQADDARHMMNNRKISQTSSCAGRVDTYRHDDRYSDNGRSYMMAQAKSAPFQRTNMDPIIQTNRYPIKEDQHHDGYYKEGSPGYPTVTKKEMWVHEKQARLNQAHKHEPVHDVYPHSKRSCPSPDPNDTGSSESTGSDRHATKRRKLRDMKSTQRDRRYHNKYDDRYSGSSKERAGSKHQRDDGSESRGRYLHSQDTNSEKRTRTTLQKSHGYHSNHSQSLYFDSDTSDSSGHYKRRRMEKIETRSDQHKCRSRKGNMRESDKSHAKSHDKSYDQSHDKSCDKSHDKSHNKSHGKGHDRGTNKGTNSGQDKSGSSYTLRKQKPQILEEPVNVDKCPKRIDRDQWFLAIYQMQPTSTAADVLSWCGEGSKAFKINFFGQSGPKNSEAMAFVLFGNKEAAMNAEPAIIEKGFLTHRYELRAGYRFMAQLGDTCTVTETEYWGDRFVSLEDRSQAPFIVHEFMLTETTEMVYLSLTRLNKTFKLSASHILSWFHAAKGVVMAKIRTGNYSGHAKAAVVAFESADELTAAQDEAKKNCKVYNKLTVDEALCFVAAQTDLYEIKISTSITEDRDLFPEEKKMLSSLKTKHTAAIGASIPAIKPACEDHAAAKKPQVALEKSEAKADKIQPISKVLNTSSYRSRSKSHSTPERPSDKVHISTNKSNTSTSKGGRKGESFIQHLKRSDGSAEEKVILALLRRKQTTTASQLLSAFPDGLCALKVNFNKPSIIQSGRHESEAIAYILFKDKTTCPLLQSFDKMKKEVQFYTKLKVHEYLSRICHGCSIFESTASGVDQVLTMDEVKMIATNPPFTLLHGLSRMHYIKLADLDIRKTATEIWSWFGLHHGLAYGVILSVRKKAIVTSEAYVAFQSWKECNEELAANHTFFLRNRVSASIMSENAIVLRLRMKPGLYVVKVSTESGQDRFLDPDEEQFLGIQRDVPSARKAKTSSVGRDSKTEPSSEVLPDFKPGFFISLTIVDPKMTACEVLSVYTSGNGRAKDVTLVCDLNGVSVVAFIRFVTMQQRNSAMSKHPFSQKCTATARAARLTKLRKTHQIVESTMSGADREVPLKKSSSNAAAVLIKTLKDGSQTSQKGSALSGNEIVSSKKRTSLQEEYNGEEQMLKKQGTETSQESSVLSGNLQDPVTTNIIDRQCTESEQLVHLLGDTNSTYYRFVKLDSDVTASELWRKFDSTQGPSTNVILVKDPAQISLFAYAAFRELPSLYLERFEADSYSLTSLHDRNSELAFLQSNTEILEASENGPDVVVSSEIRLKFKMSMQECGKLNSKGGMHDSKIVEKSGVTEQAQVKLSKVEVIASESEKTSDKTKQDIMKRDSPDESVVAENSGTPDFDQSNVEPSEPHSRSESNPDQTGQEQATGQSDRNVRQTDGIEEHLETCSVSKSSTRKIDGQLDAGPKEGKLVEEQTEKLITQQDVGRQVVVQNESESMEVDVDKDSIENVGHCASEPIAKPGDGKENPAEEIQLTEEHGTGTVMEVKGSELLESEANPEAMQDGSEAVVMVMENEPIANNSDRGEDCEPVADESDSEPIELKKECESEQRASSSIVEKADGNPMEIQNDSEPNIVHKQMQPLTGEGENVPIKLIKAVKPITEEKGIGSGIMKDGDGSMTGANDSKPLVGMVDNKLSLEEDIIGCMAGDVPRTSRTDNESMAVEKDNEPLVGKKDMSVTGQGCSATSSPAKSRACTIDVQLTVEPVVMQRVKEPLESEVDSNLIANAGHVDTESIVEQGVGKAKSAEDNQLADEHGSDPMVKTMECGSVTMEYDTGAVMVVKDSELLEREVTIETGKDNIEAIIVNMEREPKADEECEKVIGEGDSEPMAIRKECAQMDSGSIKEKANVEPIFKKDDGQPMEERDESRKKVVQIKKSPVVRKKGKSLAAEKDDEPLVEWKDKKPECGSVTMEYDTGAVMVVKDSELLEREVTIESGKDNIEAIVVSMESEPKADEDCEKVTGEGDSEPMAIWKECAQMDSGSIKENANVEPIFKKDDGQPIEEQDESRKKVVQGKKSPVVRKKGKPLAAEKDDKPLVEQKDKKPVTEKDCSPQVRRSSRFRKC